MKANLFNRYVDEVCSLFDISRQELFSKSKQQNFVDARHMLYYLCYSSPMRIRYIQEYMSKNGYSIGHSTIIYSVRVVKELIAEDADYAILISNIKKKAHEVESE